MLFYNITFLWFPRERHKWTVPYIENFDTIPTGTKELQLILQRSPHDTIICLLYCFLYLHYFHASFLLKELYLFRGRLLYFLLCHISYFGCLIFPFPPPDAALHSDPRQRLSQQYPVENRPLA